jgi:predicted RNA-binding Zn-ribbon protein involved in translation (DUF1610 family)
MERHHIKHKRYRLRKTRRNTCTSCGKEIPEYYYDGFCEECGAKWRREGRP